MSIENRQFIVNNPKSIESDPIGSDVYDPDTGEVYDFKFTIRPGRGIPARQQKKNLGNLPKVKNQTEINPPKE